MMVQSFLHAEEPKIAPITLKQGEFALGAILGAPTGLSMKYWMNSSNALDAGLGVPFASDIKFSLHGDLHWLFPAADYATGALGFYMGLGGRFRAIRKNLQDSADFGIRVPLGFEFHAQSSSLNLFAEIVPVVVLAPEGEFSLDGGAGIRYKFPRSNLK